MDKIMSPNGKRALNLMYSQIHAVRKLTIENRKLESENQILVNTVADLTGKLHVSESQLKVLQEECKKLRSMLEIQKMTKPQEINGVVEILDSDDEEEEDGQKIFNCSICAKSYVRLSFFNRHMERHQKEIVKIPKLQPLPQQSHHLILHVDQNYMSHYDET